MIDDTLEENIVIYILSNRKLDKEIATVFNVSRQAIGRIRRRYNIPAIYERIPSKELLIGKDNETLSKEFNVGLKIIRGWKTHYKIQSYKKPSWIPERIEFPTNVKWKILRWKPRKTSNGLWEVPVICECGKKKWMIISNIIHKQSKMCRSCSNREIHERRKQDRQNKETPTSKETDG